MSNRDAILLIRWASLGRESALSRFKIFQTLTQTRWWMNNQLKGMQILFCANCNCCLNLFYFAIFSYCYNLFFFRWNIPVIFCWNMFDVGHWNISVICLTVVQKLTITVVFSPYFQTLWPKWLRLFFFGHFKNVSVAYDRKNRIQVIGSGLVRLSLQSVWGEYYCISLLTPVAQTRALHIGVFAVLFFHSALLLTHIIFALSLPAPTQPISNVWNSHNTLVSVVPNRAHPRVPFIYNTQEGALCLYVFEDNSEKTFSKCCKTSKLLWVSN